MKLLFERKFLKDISNLNNKKLQSSIEEIIVDVESAKGISEIKNTKKLKGFKNVYRMKVGEYRLGFLLLNEKIVFVRFMHRKDIYKYFP